MIFIPLSLPSLHYSISSLPPFISPSFYFPSSSIHTSLLLPPSLPLLLPASLLHSLSSSLPLLLPPSPPPSLSSSLPPSLPPLAHIQLEGVDRTPSSLSSRRHNVDIAIEFLKHEGVTLAGDPSKGIMLRIRR